MADLTPSLCDPVSLLILMNRRHLVSELAATRYSR